MTRSAGHDQTIRRKGAAAGLLLHQAIQLVAMPHGPVRVGAVAVDENGRRHARHGGSLKRRRIGRLPLAATARFIEPPVGDLRQFRLQIAAAGSAAGVDQPDLGGGSGRGRCFRTNRENRRTGNEKDQARNDNGRKRGMAALPMHWQLFPKEKSLPKCNLYLSPVVEKNNPPCFQKTTAWKLHIINLGVEFPC